MHGLKVLRSSSVMWRTWGPGMVLLRGLMDLFPQSVRAVIRARTRAALAVKRSKGERYSRRAPLGYRFEAGETRGRIPRRARH
jgi:hypothetical protein